MTKDELKAYQWISRSIQKLEDKLLELETEATRQTTQLSQQPKGSSFSTDKLTDIVSKIIEVRNEINLKVKKGYAVMAEIEKVIAKLPAREEYLIRARYIELKSWEQIAVDMNYGWRHIHKIHAEALRLLGNNE